MIEQGYRYVLQEAAFEAFVQLTEEERELAHAFFRWLASHPHSTGQGFHTDSSGRPNYAAVCGPLLIVHWTDQAVKEVRVVRINKD